MYLMTYDILNYKTGEGESKDGGDLYHGAVGLCFPEAAMFICIGQSLLTPIGEQFLAIDAEKWFFRFFILFHSLTEC